MGVLDMLARAETSSDLKHHERPCDVDVLGAAGLAGIVNPPHMSIFRIKYLNDQTEMDAAKRLFVTWARKVMIERKINPSGASRAGVQALTQWINDVCQPCHGLGYAAIDGTPALSARACPRCNGTGKAPVKGEFVEVFRDLHERADSAVRAIQAGMDYRLGRNPFGQR